MAAYVAGFYWLPYTIEVFGGFPGGVSHFIFFVFAGLEGASLGIFAAGVRLAGFGPLCLFPPLFWVAIEYWYPQLFPWQLASSQSGLLPLIQSADLVGAYGTSFLLAWGNAAIYSALNRSRDGLPALRPLLAVGLLAIAALAYGYVRLEAVEARIGAAPRLAVAAVQGNIGVEMKWDPVQAEKNLRIHKELTQSAGPARLVIWPETAIEAWVPENLPQLPREVLPDFPPEVAFFIFGSRSYRGDFGTAGAEAFNSAFLTDHDGRILGVYHKQALLAFGEFIPFWSLLSKLPGVPPLGPGFSAGKEPRTLDLGRAIRVAPLICYEDLIPFLSRRFVREKGAHLLVNLTNDAWYGDSAAQWQHARLSQWRAIETRRSLVRATNTGVTAVIDARGEILQSLPTFAPGVLRAEVALLEGETFYVRFGDWLPWLATVAALALVFRRLVGKGEAQ